MKIQAADSRHRLVAYVVLMVLVAGGLASTAVGEPAPPVSQAEASKRAEVGHQDTAPPEEPADSTRRALWAQGLVQTLPTDQRAGYWVDENNTVTLYVAGDADGARRQWQEEIDSSGFDVAVVRVTYSSEQLGAQLESSRWKDRGVPQEWLAGLMGVGLDYRENALELRVLSSWAGNATDLERFLGVRVVTTVVEGPMQALYGRFEDNPPRWGGTRIKLYWPGSDLNDPNSLDKLKEPVICTAGFPAISEGYEVMTTAGHCAPYGAASTPRWAWNGKSLTEGGILCALAGCRHREVGSVWKTMAKTYSTQTQALGTHRWWTWRGYFSTPLLPRTTTVLPTILGPVRGM
jgi:hypothetical protein